MQWNERQIQVFHDYQSYAGMKAFTRALKNIFVDSTEWEEKNVRYISRQSRNEAIKSELKHST